MLTCGAWSCLQYGWTATMLAAKSYDGRTCMMESDDFRTAMMDAAYNGHVEVVDRLLAAGADKDAQSKVPGCV